MSRAACLAAALLVLAGCATIPPRPEAREPAPVAASPLPAEGDPGTIGESDLPDTSEDVEPPARDEDVRPRADQGARLAARARTFLGQRGPFRAAGERFNGDCSGYVAAVYAAEGINLRGAMQRVAPAERRGAKAAWLTLRDHGETFGADVSPEAGDLVFWHDTYDRNRNGKADNRFTHVGIVERVVDGTVHFIHRGGRGVARGVMTLAHRHEARGPDGARANSTLRARSHPVKTGGLAAELFAGFGRLGGQASSAAHARRKPAPPAQPSKRRSATAREG